MEAFLTKKRENFGPGPLGFSGGGNPNKARAQAQVPGHSKAPSTFNQSQVLTRKHAVEVLPILLVFQGIICGGEGEIENPDITKITVVPGGGCF